MKNNKIIIDISTKATNEMPAGSIKIEQPSDYYVKAISARKELILKNFKK